MIDIYSKYLRDVPLKEKKGNIITNAFQNIYISHKPKKKYGLIKIVNFTIG